MTILEASGKQEPEVKEAPSGPLEEVRAMWPTCLFFLPQEVQSLNPQSAKILSLLKGNGYPFHTPLYQDGESAYALWFQQRQVLCFLYPDAWGGVRWGVVRCTLTELSASPTPG